MHKLTAYFGERVCRASDHCSALLEWVRIMGESGYAPHVPEAYASIQLELIKSNLAARLVYGGEQVRKTPCPKHEGRWSGCVWGGQVCPEGCMYGSNVTGWLPEPHDFVERPAVDAMELEVYAKNWPDFDPSSRCWKCGGERDKPLHKVEAVA